LLGAEHLRWLSDRLEEGLDLDGGARETWLRDLQARSDPQLLTTLRELLARQAHHETADLLQRGPAFAPPDEGPQPGDTVGPYSLLKLLGSGGMGAVWLAERSDGSLKRRVALKLPHLSWASGLAARFARERDILATLEHPHIARLYDAGLDDRGRPYMALEYVEGEPIDAWCRQRALAPAARLRLLLQVAEAVAYAHGRLVLHRDLKPGNILVTAEGQVRLLDFGIAKLMQAEGAAETALTQASGRALTLDYASPEQIRGETLGTSSDVYSLGVVAFELLVGARPYRLKRGSAAELEEAITGQDVPLASAVASDPALRHALRGDLDAILNRALKKRVAERYATVDALASDWRAHLEGGRVAARPDSLAYRAARLARRHRLPLAAGTVAAAAFVLALGFGATALVVGVLLAGLGAALWQARKARAQARIAAEQAELARSESRRAQAVQGFLIDIFKANSDHQPDPARARATTARELLDLGAQRLATALHDAPEAQLEVMSTLGDMYYELQLSDQAAAIDTQRIELLRRLHGRDDRRVAQALVDLSGALHSTARRDEIVPALEEARRILDALGERNSLLRGELLSRLAQRHYNLSVARSLAYADEAVRVLRALPEPDLDHLAAALSLAGRVRGAIGEPAAADALWQQSRDTLRAMPVIPRVQWVEAGMSRAETLAQRMQWHAALALARETVDDSAATLGAEHASSIVARARQGALLHAAGERPAARPLLEEALRDALATFGEHETLYTPLVRAHAARGAYADGRLAEALRQVEAVNASRRQHYAGSHVLGPGLALQAVVLVALGRTAAARELLAEGLDIVRRGADGAYRPWRYNRWHLDRARLELADGRAGEALAALAEVVAWPETEVPAPHPELVEHNTLAALAHALAGDAAAAERHALAATDALPALQSHGRQPGLEAEAWLALGLALRASGRHADALPALRESVALRRAFDVPLGAWRRAAEAALLRGLRAAGRREDARAARPARPQPADGAAAHPPPKV